jgi:hypothetical protein
MDILTVLSFFAKLGEALQKWFFKKPNIVCIRAYVDERTVTIPPRASVDTSQTGGFPPVETLYPIRTHAENNRVETYDFAHAVFENKKRRRINTETAEKVVAYIVFYDGDNNDILEDVLKGYKMIGCERNT